jgi:uncharacterized protein YbjT (DUF2867 family)
MYPRLIAKELQARGHDVISVHDAPGSGAADEDILEYARAQGRAVVTENVRDYRPLADAFVAAGTGHSGIVFTTPKRWPRDKPGALISALDQLLKSSPEQPVNREFWLL